MDTSRKGIIILGPVDFDDWATFKKETEPHLSADSWVYTSTDMGTDLMVKRYCISEKIFYRKIKDSNYILDLVKSGMECLVFQCPEFPKDLITKIISISDNVTVVEVSC